VVLSVGTSLERPPSARPTTSSATTSATTTSHGATFFSVMPSVVLGSNESRRFALVRARPTRGTPPRREAREAQ